MTTVPLTLLFAGCCALVQCALTAWVIRRRAQTGIYFLDGGDEPLMRRVRAHGNFAETAPMALLLMALLEISGLGRAWLITLGVSLLLGRLLHAQSMLNPGPAWRRLGGMGLTLAVISIEAALALWLFFVGGNL